MINFHTERQKTKVGTSIFDETKNINFFKDLIHNQSLSWKIHLSGIKYDKNFISASISIVHGKVFYFWIPSFNPSFKGGSIGQLHIKQLLKICFDTNIEIFDFMGGNEAYKVAGQINPMKIITYLLTEVEINLYLIIYGPCSEKDCKT